MDKIHKEALKCCRTQLLEDITFEELADYLLSEGVLSEIMIERISSGVCRPERVSLLLSELPRRGPKAYGIFIDCLRSAGQNHLADAILEAEQKLRNDGECNLNGGSGYVTQSTKGGTRHADDPGNVKKVNIQGTGVPEQNETIIYKRGEVTEPKGGMSRVDNSGNVDKVNIQETGVLQQYETTLCKRDAVVQFTGDKDVVTMSLGNKGIVAKSVTAVNIQTGDNSTTNCAPEQRLPSVRQNEAAEQLSIVQTGDSSTVNVTQEITSPGMQSLLDKTIQRLKFHEKKEGQLFVGFRAFEQCQIQLAEKGFVVIVGAPGDGKTTMSLEMLCRIRDRTTHKKIIIINNKENWGKFDWSDRELVILFDDMFGELRMNENLKNFWVSELPDIISLIENGNTQVIITCRESIFGIAKDELERFDLFNTDNRIHLSGPQCKYPLDAKTKFKIIKKHVELGENIQICSNKSEQILSPSPGQQCLIWIDTLKKISDKIYLGFMQTCKVFVSGYEYRRRGEAFFDHPSEFLLFEFDRLRKSDKNYDKFNYCTLACVLVKQGLKLDQVVKDEIVKKIATSCRITDTSTLKYEINLAFERLASTYLINRNGNYQFQHNSWIESVFKSFFKVNPSLLIEYCQFGLIEDLITTEHAIEKSTEFCQISDSENKSLCGRLVSEITAGNVEFCHRCFTDAQFTDTFCQYVDESGEKQKETVLLSKERKSMLEWSALRADLSLVKWVVDGLSTLNTDIDLSGALNAACNGGNLPVVEWLLSMMKGTEVDDDRRKAAGDIATYDFVGHSLNVKYKNLKQFTDSLSSALKIACTNHHSDVIHQLLTQAGIDSGFDWDDCLQKAARWGDVDVVTELIKYGQFTADALSLAVALSIRKHHSAVFHQLLTQDGIDSGHWWEDCWGAAALWGNVDVVTKLMKYGNATADVLSRAVKVACEENHSDLFDLLLAQPGIDGGRWWNRCLKAAAWREIDEVTHFADRLRSEGYNLPNIDECN